MARFLVACVIAAVLGAAGAFVGWSADTNVASALVLHAEPLLLVALVWSIAGARWAGLPHVSYGLSAGTILFVAALRLPFPVAAHDGAAPPWMAPVSRCAAALRMPSEPVRLLQWTLDPTVSPEAVRDVVTATKPDVIVFHGVTAAAQVAGLDGVVTGEGRLVGEGGTTWLFATGGFHPCGDGAEWSEAIETGDDLAIVFAGVPPATIFPLVVTAFPGPLAEMWAPRTDALSGALLDAVTGLQGASTVVVSDARVPRTARTLDARFADRGLASIPLPPSWPARLGPVPALTLHPYARMWAGPVWEVRSTARVATFAGSFAPVLAEIAGPAAPVAPADDARERRRVPTIEEAPPEE